MTKVSRFHQGSSSMLFVVARKLLLDLIPRGGRKLFLIRRLLLGFAVHHDPDIAAAIGLVVVGFPDRLHEAHFSSGVMLGSKRRLFEGTFDRQRDIHLLVNNIVSRWINDRDIQCNSDGQELKEVKTLRKDLHGDSTLENKTKLVSELGSGKKL